ncbi:MAG: thioredoxin domain-containing protein [Pseudomonadota bacterium]
MRKLRAPLVLFSCILLVSQQAGSSSPGACSSLKGDEKQTAESIMAESYPYGCCDKTIDKCLKEKKVCKLAVRLAGEICMRVSKGESKDDIKTALSRRANSMMASGKKYEIDTGALDTWAGDEVSKVTLVAYVCARCPYCAKIMPKLYSKVTEGELKGKVKLHVKIFPIKGHESSGEGGKAMAAAAQKGKFWPFMLKLYGSFKDFDVSKLSTWAKDAGMVKGDFEKLMKSKQTETLVVNSKKEGLKNGVEGTPTFFINGRKYKADQKLTYFVDALLEEHDRLTGVEYEK